MGPVDAMSKEEIDRFLEESRIPLKLGSVDEHGDPVIHPLWYLYDGSHIYIITAVNSRKMRSITGRRSIYFCVDTETRPYKGVKGKGSIAPVTDRERALKLGEELVSKYMGGIDNDIGKFLIGRLREAKETLLEITPRYFCVWDDSKSP